MAFNNDRLSALNFGNVYPSETEVSDLLSNERGVRYRDAVHISLPSGEAWVFDYGVIVFWAVDEDERRALLQRLHLEDNIVEDNKQEHFRFTTSGTEIRISRDTIALVDDDLLTRLAISHALAQ